MNSKGVLIAAGLITLAIIPIVHSYETSLKNQRDSEKIVVSRVIDGDTVEIYPKVFGVKIVRLEGIDTPELKQAHCPKEIKLGYEAKGYAKALLSGKKVSVVSKGKKDRYNRLLARIYIDGKDYSQVMIDEGYAVKWTKEWRETPKERRWC